MPFGGGLGIIIIVGILCITSIIFFITNIFDKMI
jgi:hypothetical protein